MKLKLKASMKLLAARKKCFIFTNYSTRSKYCDNPYELVIRNTKDKTGGVAIEEFVGLNPKMYSFLVNNKKNENKKQFLWIEMLLLKQDIMNIKM